VDAGELQLHGAYFGIASGHLLVRDPKTRRFEPVVSEIGTPPSLLRCD
jgi:carbonic anhydrase